MTEIALKRPHFRNPPIFEQAIALTYERIRDYGMVDPGLFWALVRDRFPQSETAPRLPTAVELFDGQDQQLTLTAVPSLQLPRTVFKDPVHGELLQLQDDKFVFNWVRPSEDAQYPRFELTSARLWEFYEVWSEFIRGLHGEAPQLRQCELTNVNIIPVNSFGHDFNDMNRAFVVDPFDWNVPGLVAETYIRQRVHLMVDDDSQPLGRLHSSISPVFGSDGEKAFQFELTARSAPTIKSLEDARNFFDRAHMMINGAFVASVTKQMRDFWGERDGE